MGAPVASSMAPGPLSKRPPAGTGEDRARRRAHSASPTGARPRLAGLRPMAGFRRGGGEGVGGWGDYRGVDWEDEAKAEVSGCEGEAEASKLER